MAGRVLVTLSRSLPGFVEPDTQSDTEGRVPAGTYAVLERLPDQGDTNDDDYARIAIHGLDGDDTWICTKSGANVYGVFTEADPEPPGETVTSDASDGIPEDLLIARLPAFQNYRYTRTGAKYPFDIEGCNLPTPPPNKNNCCTFVEALVVRAWQDHDPQAFAWNSARHRQMMIIGDDLFSPVNCVVEAGMAEAVADPDAPPPPWSIVQGWRTNGGGHTFLIVDHDRPTDRVLTLESNRGYGLDGVGFRSLGNLRERADNGPPPAWWSNPSAPTWAQICASYPERKLAALKVTNRSWSRTGT